MSRFSAYLSTLSVLFNRYFGDGFRVKEFTAVVAASFTAGVWLGSQMMLSPERAAIIGDALAAVTAVAYIRNPKARQWKEQETDGNTANASTPTDSAS